MTHPSTSVETRCRLYRLLIDGGARLGAAADPEERWMWLMAAHVVGQSVLALHWDSHVRMLGLAWRLRDGREVAGQLLRLGLVPLGHLLQRLPVGNVGRATVSAFRPMRPPVGVRRVIGEVRRGVAPRGALTPAFSQGERE